MQLDLNNLFSNSPHKYYILFVWASILQGDPGIPGERGVQGERGYAGDSGSLGQIGPKGQKGEPGLPGQLGSASLLVSFTFVDISQTMQTKTVLSDYKKTQSAYFLRELV